MRDGVEGGDGLGAHAGVGPRAVPCLLIPHRGDAGAAVAVDEATGDDGLVRRVVVGDRAREGELAGDLRVGDLAQVGHGVADGDGHGDARGVADGDGAEFAVDGVVGGDGDAVGVEDAHPGEAGPAAVDDAAGGDRLRGGLGGVHDQCEVARAVDGHAAVGGQAHGVDAEDVGVEREVFVADGVVADGVGDDRTRRGDGAGGVGAESHAGDAHLVVDGAEHVGADEIAVGVGCGGDLLGRAAVGA